MTYVEAATAPLRKTGHDQAAWARRPSKACAGPGGWPRKSSMRWSPMVQPGVTTEALDDLVREFTLDHGAVPATLGYRGYAHSRAASRSTMSSATAFPSDKPLKDGDIVNIDVTPLLDGWHGDSSRMYLVGDVPLKARAAGRSHLRVPDARHRSRRSPASGSATSAPRSSAMPRPTAMAWCASSAATASAACSTMRPKSSTPRAPGTGPELRPGMFFTIEPMINLGKAAR